MKKQSPKLVKPTCLQFDSSTQQRAKTIWDSVLPVLCFLAQNQLILQLFGLSCSLDRTEGCLNQVAELHSGKIKMTLTES